MTTTADENYPRVFFYRRLVQAKLYIDRHYADNIDLDNIAGEVYSSKFHFIRQFKSLYHKTPHQYLVAVRIARAKELLQLGEQVSSVCYAVGFESLSSFTHLFKRLTGSTPSEYLAVHQALRQKVAETPFSFIPACFARQSGWL